MSLETLRSFRRNAVHVRQALDLLGRPDARSTATKLGGGYLQDEGLVERYKRLSIPVRRAMNAHDKAAFTQALASLAALLSSPHQSAGTPAVTLTQVEQAWTELQQELDTTVGLGGAKVPRREILARWLDAAAFYDKLERDRAYDQLIDQSGKAAEAIGAELMEHAARVVLVLDAAAAAALGEPLILPPPPKTPPPPPDPKESLWRRLFGRKAPVDD